MEIENFDIFSKVQCNFYTLIGSSNSNRYEPIRIRNPEENIHIIKVKLCKYHTVSI
jgi:hypothetical protein